MKNKIIVVLAVALMLSCWRVAVLERDIEQQKRESAEQLSAALTRQADALDAAIQKERKRAKALKAENDRILSEVTAHEDAHSYLAEPLRIYLNWLLRGEQSDQDVSANPIKPPLRRAAAGA